MRWTCRFVGALFVCVALTACGGATAVAPPTAAPATLPAAATQPPDQPSQPAQADADQISAIVRDALKADQAPEGQTIAVQQQDGDYARVSATGGGMTTYYFLKRQGAAWVIVGMLAGPVVNLDHLRAQGFPDQMLRDLEVDLAATAGLPANPTASGGDPVLDAVAAYLNLGPDVLAGKVQVAQVQGRYARVVVTPPGSDGLTLFVQESQGGWFVLAEGGDLGAARERGVPEELLSGSATP